MSGRATESNVAEAKAAAIASAARVDPCGVSAEVEDPGHRRGVRLHHARFEVQGRTHHAHAVHVLEQAERGGFVGHTVLQRDHRDGRRGGRGQGAERLAGVLALHRQQHDVVVTEVDAGGV